jgi:hypothetical protein
MQEEWRPVVGYENFYEVSSIGRVRSFDRICANSYVRRGQILKGLPNKYQYLHVGLSNGAKQTTKTIHELVATSFLGPRPKGFVTDHIDNNRTNNHVENLQYITVRENNTKDIKRDLPTGVGKRDSGRFRAKIQIKSQNISLGTFDTVQEASEAYQNALKQIKENA